MTLGWGKMWATESDCAYPGPVPASGKVLYGVQSLHPPALSVRPPVVLEGATEAGLTTTGHGESTLRWIITCLRFLRGKW